MISRRQFLTYAAIGAGAIAVPELLLPKRTFFLPPKGGWNSGKAFITFDPGSKDGTAFQAWHIDDAGNITLYSSGDLTGESDVKNYNAAVEAAGLPKSAADIRYATSDTFYYSDFLRVANRRFLLGRS